MDLSAMGAGETSHPSQLIPVVPLNPDGTSSIPTPVLPPKAKPKARKRKLDDANIDIRPSIEVQVNATKAPRTAAPRKPRKPREPRAATSSTPKPRAPRKKRAETPEDAEDQEIDHSTIKMADLCKDLKIGKKFSKHDEIKQRDIDRKAKAKLRRENPELVGASDDERPTATTRSETETPLQTTSVGPRMRLVDGQIVIDESSLNLDRHKLAAANAGVMEIIEENEFTRITTSGTFMKREKNIFWDLEAEEKFYVGLRMFGTDFEMISKMFPDRNRRQIKLKFNKEERLYPSKINSALLGEKVPINFDEYKSHTGLEYEDVAVINAEREEIEAEQNAEEARVEAELAEATRQKKAAIHATRGPEGKENNTFGGGSNSAKAKNKGKKKNKASAFGGGEDVEYLGDI
jgi:transcription factor TFIIIB component B''